MAHGGPWDCGGYQAPFSPPKPETAYESRNEHDFTFKCSVCGKPIVTYSYGSIPKLHVPEEGIRWVGSLVGIVCSLECDEKYMACSRECTEKYLEDNL